MKNIGTILLTVCIIMVVGQGCDNHENDAVSANAVSDKPLSGAAVAEYVRRLQDIRAVTDDSYATVLMEDLEALSDGAKAQLIDAIGHIGPGYEAHDAGDSASVELALTATIPVSWATWPTGKMPNYVGTTKVCGGDTDLSVEFSNVAGAYANPGSLKLTTNSLYVWGIMAVHGFKATAYDITAKNTVKLCIGVKGAAGIWGISQSLQAMFWIGLWIK